MFWASPARPFCSELCIASKNMIDFTRQCALRHIFSISVCSEFSLLLIYFSAKNYLSFSPSESVCRWREIVALSIKIFPIILTIFVHTQSCQLPPDPLQAGAGVALRLPHLHLQSLLADFHVGQAPLVLILLTSIKHKCYLLFFIKI